ncbi:glycosyltransferase family 2 protein [Marinobacterium mangrovicola]|uniref:Glycosyl transferase family 2 n=1 Tax=Marinobacterium mangrovicola TaxID=1476959 RepID=A0A4R1GGT0_9GAMM|nr:glycosyltransferase [Marinobacterium mangrovicola]TCK07544.1 glycosyl transferase family 2 [Marinobacterium mangrovicola]
MRRKRWNPEMISPSTSPRVSVIIPHYDDVESLRQCLEALNKLDTPRSEYELVLADNDSPDFNTRFAPIAHLVDKVLTVKQKGAGPARNGGVEVASAPTLAFIDSDCVPHQDWLNKGIDSLHHCDIAGCKVVVTTPEARALSGAEAFELCFAFNNQRYIEEEGFTVTAGIFCKRELFKKVGGFKTGVSEDKEWCHRATQKGYILGYAGLSIIEHPPRKNWDELKIKWRRLNRETYALILTKPNGKLRWFLRTLLLPISAVIHTPKIFNCKSLVKLESKLSATQTLYKIRLWRFYDGLRLIIDDIK